MITDRVDGITAIPTLYRTPLPPPPRSVKIELTARCDFKCFFCATGQKLRDKADMDKDLLNRILSELRDVGVEEIGMFYLGESFLFHDLPESIAYARKLGFPYIFLTTNGRMAIPDRVKACMEAGLDSLKFSFNSCFSLSNSLLIPPTRINAGKSPKSMHSTPLSATSRKRAGFAIRSRPRPDTAVVSMHHQSSMTASNWRGCRRRWPKSGLMWTNITGCRFTVRRA